MVNILRDQTFRNLTRLAVGVLLSKDPQIVVMADERNPDGEPCFLVRHRSKLTAGALGVGVAILGVPFALTSVGFTPIGIKAGSVAAGWMSSTAIANSGGVAASSMVAAAQSAGAAGIGATAMTAAGTVGGTVGAIAPAVGYRVWSGVKQATYVTVSVGGRAGHAARSATSYIHNWYHGEPDADNSSGIQCTEGNPPTSEIT